MSTVQRTTTREEWRHVTPAIAGFPVRPGYQVSDRGRVRSLWKRGHAVLTKWWRPLKGHKVDDTGYQQFTLRQGDGRERKVNVHRMVAIAFIGPPPFEGAEVCHGDGNPQNNYLDNLRWGSHQDNLADKIAHGRQPRGEQMGTAKLTNAEALGVVTAVRAGKLIPEVAARYGITESLVYRILRGDRWASVTHITDRPSRRPLTAEKVREIVQLWAWGMLPKDIAAQYGIAKSMVQNIVNGRNWSEVTGLTVLR